MPARIYSYVDGSDETPRVRWTNRDTGKEHSYTTSSPREAATLQRYLAQFDARVDRKSHVFKTGAWKTGFPDPSEVMAGKTFGEYARENLDERFNRKRIIRRSYVTHSAELERTRVPINGGRSLYDTPLADLMEAKRLIEKFEASLASVEFKPGKWYAPNTVRQTLHFVIGVLRLAGEDKLIPRDALGNYRAPDARRRQSKRAIEYRDYLGMRANIHERDVRLMVDVIAGTGCRLAELMGLRREDILVDEDVCMIRFSEQEYRDKTRQPLKTTRTKDDSETPYRDVRIPRWLGNDLLSFIRETGRSSGSLFLSPQNPRQTWSHEGFESKFKRIARTAMAAGDMPLWPDQSHIPTPHNLRHSYVSWALGNRLSPETIAKRTGHSSATLLSTYAESLSESEAAMDEHLEELNPHATATPSGTPPVACCEHCGLPAVA